MKGMKFAICIVLAVVATANSFPQEALPLVRLSEPEPRNDVDDAIIKALEALRKLMPKGIPEWGVPVLEPLKVPHADLKIDSELANITGSLDDIMIQNLSTFKIVKIANDMENLKADFDLFFERISLSGHYNITGKAMGSIDVFGDGPFTIIVDEFAVGGTVHLTTESGSKDSPAEIDKMTARFSVNSMKVNLENIMGGGDLGELVNSLITESAPEFIQKYQKELSGLVAQMVVKMVNPILGHFTLKEILDFLGVPN